MMYRPNRTAINCHRTAQTRRLRSKIVVSKRCHPFLESWSPTDFLTNGIEAESTQISVDWSFSSRSSRFFFLSFWQPKTWVMPEISSGSIRIRGVDVCVHVYVYIYIYVEIHIGMEYKLQRPHRDVTGMMANGTTIPLNGKTFSFSVVNYYDLSRHVYIGFAVSFFFLQIFIPIWEDDSSWRFWFSGWNHQPDTFLFVQVYTYGYGSIPIHTILSGLFTSINPSYFDVNLAGVLLVVLTHLWQIQKNPTVKNVALG